MPCAGGPGVPAGANDGAASLSSDGLSETLNNDDLWDEPADNINPQGGIS